MSGKEGSPHRKRNGEGTYKRILTDHNYAIVMVKTYDC
jgi:hypothetical protein